jgi:predicted DCC family thiol-disulfide oxidoreductase YuxK
MTPDEQTGDQKSERACLLIYDGECRLCVATKQKLEQVGIGQAGSDVQFVAYQSEEAKRILGQSYRLGRPDMAFLVRPSGEVHQGLEAFLPLAPSLPGGRFLLWCLRIPLAKRLAEWGYRMIAKHRYRLFGEARSSRSQG